MEKFFRMLDNALSKIYDTLSQVWNEDYEMDKLTKEDWRKINEAVLYLNKNHASSTKVELSVGVREISI